MQNLVETEPTSTTNAAARLALTRAGGIEAPTEGSESRSLRPAPAEAAAAESPAWIGARYWSLFTLQDTMLVAYATIVCLLVWRAERGVTSELAAGCLRHVSTSLGLLLLGVLFARGARDVPARFRSIVYRVAMGGVLPYNYLMLRDVLPIVRPDSVDAQLYDLDLRVFGFEPALWLERFNQPPIVEWFSFFYYSYFWMDLVYLVAVIWVMRPSRLTTTFGIGTVIVFCVGQLGYMAVPGYGPISFLADKYHGPVNGGFFWGLVWETYAVGSAMKDIFPSLHTAIPVWFTFFAFHAAKTDRRWRWAAYVQAFFAANIIVSTMLLRWHYAIDVVVGLALSTATGLLAPRIAAWEEARRARRGLPGAWVFDSDATATSPLR